jgi:hypothetical protein
MVFSCLPLLAVFVDTMDAGSINTNSDSDSLCPPPSPCRLPIPQRRDIGREGRQWAPMIAPVLRVELPQLLLDHRRERIPRIFVSGAGQRLDR